MKTLYLDCGMGAAGDMLTAALLELVPERDAFVEELNTLGIEGVLFRKEAVSKCGIRGTHISVTVHGEEETEGMNEHSAHGHHHGSGEEHCHHHHHSGMEDIRRIVEGLAVSGQVKKDILAVYGLIAEAESHVHGVPVNEIHFHEVGTMDAVADITAVCMLMERIAPDQVIVSPVHVGSGQVKCAHGILPVPAPAAAYILREVPVYGGAVQGELCTPTGAALLKHFAARFGDMPVMKIQAIGYGMGKKDFPAANCVRALLGETEDVKDAIVELSCNMDDMTGEAAGFAMETLFAAGALEVYTVPIGMKKSRPGILLCVMCRKEDKDEMVRLMFLHTSTIGIRENLFQRYTLDRSVEAVHTKYGEIRKKVSAGYGVTREKYEYEDIARAAREHSCSIGQVLSELNQR